MPHSNSPSSVEDAIKGFIVENLLYGMDEYPYPDDASFLQEGIVDSLGVMQLVDFVRKEFGITFTQQEVTPANFDSVRNLAAFVRKKLQAPAPR